MKRKRSSSLGTALSSKRRRTVRSSSEASTSTLASRLSSALFSPRPGRSDSIVWTDYLLESSLPSFQSGDYPSLVERSPSTPPSSTRPWIPESPLQSSLQSVFGRLREFQRDRARYLRNRQFSDVPDDDDDDIFADVGSDYVCEAPTSSDLMDTSRDEGLVQPTVPPLSFLSDTDRSTLRDRVQQSTHRLERLERDRLQASVGSSRRHRNEPVGYDLLYGGTKRIERTNFSASDDFDAREFAPEDEDPNSQVSDADALAQFRQQHSSTYGGMDLTARKKKKGGMSEKAKKKRRERKAAEDWKRIQEMGNQKKKRTSSDQ